MMLLHRRTAPLALSALGLSLTFLRVPFSASSAPLSAAAVSYSSAAAPSLGPTLPATGLPGPPSVVLYQYESCPFCNKVRAYLDFRRVKYTVVEVDPLFKSALSFSSYKKVPLAVVDGEAIGDSTAIINAVEARLRASGLAGATGDEGAAWRAWCDATLVKHLTVNIYRSPSEALQTFDYLTQRNFPWWSALGAKYVGAAAMLMVAGKRRKELGVGEEVGKEREALSGVLDELVRGCKGQPYLGGQLPGLGDVSVFGVLRSIKGLPTHSFMLEHSGAKAWYLRMEGAVGGSTLQHRVGEK
jgi:microsomal prostaglandin-E synthase 2